MQTQALYSATKLGVADAFVGGPFPRRSWRRRWAQRATACRARCASCACWAFSRRGRQVWGAVEPRWAAACLLPVHCLPGIFCGREAGGMEVGGSGVSSPGWCGAGLRNRPQCLPMLHAASHQSLVSHATQPPVAGVFANNEASEQLLQKRDSMRDVVSQGRGCARSPQRARHAPAVLVVHASPACRLTHPAPLPLAGAAHGARELWRVYPCECRGWQLVPWLARLGWWVGLTAAHGGAVQSGHAAL